MKFVFCIFLQKLENIFKGAAKTAPCFVMLNRASSVSLRLPPSPTRFVFEGYRLAPNSANRIVRLIIIVRLINFDDSCL